MLLAREAFIHRRHRPGDAMEADFGESFAVVAVELRRVELIVTTLPRSNVSFAQAVEPGTLRPFLEAEVHLPCESVQIATSAAPFVSTTS